MKIRNRFLILILVTGMLGAYSSFADHESSTNNSGDTGPTILARTTGLFTKAGKPISADKMQHLPGGDYIVKYWLPCGDIFSGVDIQSKKRPGGTSEHNTPKLTIGVKLSKQRNCLARDIESKASFHLEPTDVVGYQVTLASGDSGAGGEGNRCETQEDCGTGLKCCANSGGIVPIGRTPPPVSKVCMQVSGDCPPVP